MLQKIASNYLSKLATDGINPKYRPLYDETLDLYGDEYKKFLQSKGVKAILGDNYGGDLVVLTTDGNIKILDHETDEFYEYKDNMTVDDFKKASKAATDPLASGASSALVELLHNLRSPYTRAHVTFNNYGNNDYGLDMYAETDGKKTPIDISESSLDRVEKQYIKELIKRKVKKAKFEVNSDGAYTADFKY